jgi:hypothetical protein
MPVNQVSRKCARTTARALYHRQFHRFACIGSTVNIFSDLPFVSRNGNLVSHNGNLVLRYVVRLSCLYSSIRINLNLCNAYVIHVNCN